jgi:uncharacterized membrane protein YhaH (DUF805 family)
MIRQYKQEKDRLPDCNLPSVEAVPGFEHGDTGLADHCLAAWLHRHKNNSNSISYFFEKVNLILLFSMIRFLSVFINCNLHIIMEMIDTLFKERLSMNFTYEFPDITGYIQKSGTYKKPRRISGLRLGENRTAVEKRFPLSLSRRDEDKDIDYFTVSMKEKISLFDEEVTSLGCSFVKGKAALLFADFIFSTEEMRNRLTSLFGKPAKVKDVLLWTDAATSIFLMANENSASLILADTALEQAYIDEEQLANSAEMENAGFRKTLWKKYGDPVGRIGQKTYIVRALLVGIPTAAMFACTWIRPELFAGDANIFIISFMVLGTLGFVSLISLAIRRLSDIGLSHLYYWGFFGFLFISNQAGAKLLSDELLATRITGMFFFAAVILLAFIPGQKTKNKYGPVPK